MDIHNVKRVKTVAVIIGVLGLVLIALNAGFATAVGVIFVATANNMERKDLEQEERWAKEEADGP